MPQPNWAAAASGAQPGQRPHLLSLLNLRQHYDRVALALPHHPPEVLDRVRQRPLRGYEVILVPVALWGEQRSGADLLPAQGHSLCGGAFPPAPT